LGLCYLIATDFHGDHTTGAAFVEDVTFIAPQFVYEEVSKGTNAFFKKIFVETLRDQGHTNEAAEIQEAAVPLPQVCFEDSLILHLHPLTLVIRRMGGHSPACSVVYVPEEGVLFSGDVVINGPSAGMRDANVAQWVKALSWVEELPVDTIVPGHGEVCGKEVVRRLKDRLIGIWKAMEKLVQEGRTKAEAVVDSSFAKYFFADTSHGAYWLQQRKDTFREGLERLYDEVKGG
jgi:cyclase